jgi:hypothetical protein
MVIWSTRTYEASDNLVFGLAKMPPYRPGYRLSWWYRNSRYVTYPFMSGPWVESTVRPLEARFSWHCNINKGWKTIQPNCSRTPLASYQSVCKYLLAIRIIVNESSVMQKKQKALVSSRKWWNEQDLSILQLEFITHEVSLACIAVLPTSFLIVASMWVECNFNYAFLEPHSRAAIPLDHTGFLCLIR